MYHFAIQVVPQIHNHHTHIHTQIYKKKLQEKKNIEISSLVNES